MQAAKCGITRPAKVQQLADGGFVKAVKGIVDKLTTQTPKDAPLGSGLANQAKEALTTRKQVLDDAEKKAVGMAKGGAVRYPMKGGGKIPGKSPTPTADNIKIDATAGEFMIKEPSAKILGPKVLNALNAVGDGPGKAPVKPAKGRGAVRKMAMGGYVEDDAKFVRPARAPQMLANQSNPTNAAMVANGRAPVVSAPVAPNYTTSPGAAPASNAIKFVMPPEPIAATTSPGAAPAAKAAPTPAAAPTPTPAPTTVPAARVAPQPENWAQNKYQPPPAAAPAAPRADAVVRGTGFTVTPPPTAPSMVERAMGAVKSAAPALGPAAAVAAAIPEQMQVAQVAADPNTTKIDVMTQQAQGVGRYAGAGAGAMGGAALGAMTGPAAPIAVPLGALAGGAYGYWAANKAIEGGRNAAGVDPRAPVDQIPAASAPAPAAAAAPAAGPAYPENAAKHSIAPPASPQAVANSVANPVNPNGAVTRIGNSYSGAPGISGDISVNGAAPKGGFVRGTGDGTFTYGASGGGSSNGGGVSDQALHAARLGAVRNGDIEGVKASYAAQGQDFGPKVDPIQALLNNGRPMTTRKAAALAALQKQAADQASGEEQRKLERDKFGLDAMGAKLDNEGKAQLGALRKVLIDPKASEKQKAEAASSVRALLGKNDPPPVREFAVPGGQVLDPATGAVTTQPSTVYDPSTKSYISPPSQRSALPPGLVVGASSKQADGTYQAGGRTVVIKGGKVTEIN